MSNGLDIISIFASWNLMEMAMELHPRIERALGIWHAFVCKLRGFDDEEEMRIDRKERLAARDEDAWAKMEMGDDGWDM